MNILITAYTFFPEIGGIQTFTDTLASELTRMGHTVVIITPKTRDTKDNYPYKVIRKPSIAEFIKWTHWCDVFYQSNISLRMAWPLLIFRRPWVITYHIWMLGVNQEERWTDKLKQLLTRYAKNIAVSGYLSSLINSPTKVIANPYNDIVFYRDPSVKKDNTFVFVGRLVSEKGADIAIKAIGHLKKQGYNAKLKIIGSGPDSNKLKILAQDLDLLENITFMGLMRNLAIARELNEHEVLVVPSIFNEPFGIVALEGIACGCAVIGASGGGLPEVIGKYGSVFQSGNDHDLANKMKEYLDNKDLAADKLKGSEEYLENFNANTIANEYLKQFDPSSS